MPLNFGIENFKGDEIENRVIRLQIMTTPTIAHLFGTLARKNETNTSSLGHKALCYYLDKRGDLTDDEKEAVNVAIGRVEKETKEGRVKELYRLMYYPKNTRWKCEKAKGMGYPNDYIVSQIIEPTIDAVKKHEELEELDVSQVLVKLEELKMDFSGDSDED